MTNHPPTKAELRASFERISKTHDKLQEEYDIAIEAKKLNIPVDEYRRYYELRGEISFIKDLNWWRNPIDWGRYRGSVLRRFIVKNRAIFGIVMTAGSTTVGVVRYIWDAPKREKQAQYQAWQIINSAKTSEASSAGRIQALQDLVKDDVNLENLNISNAYLVNIELTNAKLNNANLNKAKLNNAQLNNAKLVGATLIFAKLDLANLRGANLDKADLGEAILINADFGEAILSNADLGETNLNGVNLEGANLDGAKFYRAKNINLEEIKTAKNWEKACYDPDLRQQLKLPQNPKCDE
jgi:BTB/POZ domain-containing protein KCTD9